MAFDPKPAFSHLRVRGDTVGIFGGVAVAGIFCWLIPKVSLLPLPQALLVVFIFGGAAAGLIATLVTEWSRVPGDFRSPLAGRIGIRAGAFVALTAGFIVLWLGSLSSRGVAVPVPPFGRVLWPVALSILPCVLAGHIAGALGAACWAGSAYNPGLEWGSKRRIHAWHFGVGAALVLVAAQPFFRPRAEVMVETANIPSRPSKAPLLPKPAFSYKPPERFLQADPRTVSIVARKAFPNISKHPRPDFSPDDQKLAFGKFKLLRNRDS